MHYMFNTIEIASITTMETNINKLEDLINQLDPNKVQCHMCKKWQTVSIEAVEGKFLCEKCVDDYIKRKVDFPE